MKTSNKLLLGLATLLLIIPMIVLAINVKINYIAETGCTYMERQELNAEPFNKQTIGRLAIPILKPFKSVNFVDAKQLSIEIHLMKSDVFGVKVPEFMKDCFIFNVDENGILNVSVKGKPEFASNEINGVTLVIYAPIFKKLDITNVFRIELSAVSDSLQINLTNTNFFNVSGAITFNNDKGKIIRTINQSEVQNLYLNLNNSNFQSAERIFKNLIITTKGNCMVEINGDEKRKEKYTIDNLTINTIDTASVSINNMLVKNCAGKISDNTTLNMPVINMKQFFKE